MSAPRFVYAAVLLLLAPLATSARAQQVTMETLLDRIQIEDLLTRYDYDLSQGKAHEPSDPVIEVRGNRAMAHVISGPGSRTRGSASRRW